MVGMIRGRGKRMGVVRSWLARAHQTMRKHRGYSRGAQALLNRYGHKISNPHVRSVVQHGINRLGQAGYGRYCRGPGAYTKRTCKTRAAKMKRDGTHRIHCSSYTKRKCKSKITTRSRRRR